MNRNLVSKLMLFGALSTLPFYASALDKKVFVPEKAIVRVESLNLINWDVSFEADFISDNGEKVSAIYRVEELRNGFHDVWLISSEELGPYKESKPFIPEYARAKFKGFNLMKWGFDFVVKYFYKGEEITTEYISSKQGDYYEAVLQDYTVGNTPEVVNKRETARRGF